ncbi:thiol-disulfide oxidoreductase DCC family protein [Methylorubrum suomiense]|uniref:DUF393 domain-containing protein n=1 Tax=Methylorubrum suomiense TaxID=144191 RepID=A0ABQ4UQX9_9HYPH|nr:MULTISPECIES: DUF393 domain-containing protein [Methylobacteriaceae]GJE74716.1 hypothetical protein BGCPKDLD_1289 [Methylorubrum suomiense]
MTTPTGPSPSAPPADATELTVYYDGRCPLCRAEIDHYRNSRGAERLAFVDVAGEGAARLGPDLDRATALRRFHVRARDGRLSDGAAAFARIWLTLPGWRWLGRILDARLFGTRPFLIPAEAAYRLSLPLRPYLARLLTRLRLI